MKRPETKSAFFISAFNRSPRQPVPLAETTAQSSFKHNEYVDGYTYRKLATSPQGRSAIQGFFRDFLGRDACSEELEQYMQQWHQGRSLRSIRDEIANCLEAQRYGW